MGCCGEQAARLLSYVGIQEALARRGRAVFKRLEMTEGSPRTAQQPAKHRVLKRLGSRIRELRHERGLSQGGPDAHLAAGPDAPGVIHPRVVMRGMLPEGYPPPVAEREHRRNRPAQRGYGATSLTKSRGDGTSPALSGPRSRFLSADG